MQLSISNLEDLKSEGKQYEIKQYDGEEHNVKERRYEEQRYQWLASINGDEGYKFKKHQELNSLTL